MAIAKKRTKMRRTQISLPEEQFEAARMIAKGHGISISGLIRDTLRDRIAEEVAPHDPFRHLIGMVKDGDPTDSVNHDEVIYGPSIH